MLTFLFALIDSGVSLSSFHQISFSYPFISIYFLLSTTLVQNVSTKCFLELRVEPIRFELMEPYPLLDLPLCN